MKDEQKGFWTEQELMQRNIQEGIKHIQCAYCNGRLCGYFDRQIDPFSVACPMVINDQVQSTLGSFIVVESERLRNCKEVSDEKSS